MESSFTFSDVFRFSFKKYKENFFIILGFSLLMGFIFYVSINIKTTPTNVVFGILIFFYYIAGLTNLSIKLLNDDKCKFSDSFISLKNFIKYLIGLIIYWFIISLGFIFFIIPGVILGLRFQFFSFYIIHKNTSLIESFKKSYEITRGIKLQLKLFLFWFIAFNIHIFVFFLFFITLPMNWIMHTFIYYFLSEPSAISLIAKENFTKNNLIYEHVCPRCSKNPPYATNYGLLCTECEDQISNEILLTKNISEETEKYIENFQKSSSIKFYENLYNRFTYDNELDLNEISLLNKIQQIMKLSNREVQYTERILPYMYVYYIKSYNKLPDITKETKNQLPTVILKSDEIVHFTYEANIIELKTFSEYVGGSSGFSFHVAKGVTYRVGGHRGYYKKVERYVVTSKGNLLITSQRLFLQPYPGNKPVSIFLDKILSYNCYSNGIEVYTDSGKKQYFFEINNSGAVEIFGICLSHLYNS